MPDRMPISEREQQLVQDRGAQQIVVVYRQGREQRQREEPFVVAGERPEAISGQLLVERFGRSFVAQLQVKVGKLAAEEWVPREPLGGILQELEGFARTSLLCSDEVGVAREMFFRLGEA